MTKHLDSLKIQNFRMLEDFEVAKLGQVNLIVGKNNSGKSTVLEALRVYAAHAQVFVLEDIAKSHDEKYQFLENERGNLAADIPFLSFFSGGIMQHYLRLSIGDSKQQIELIYLDMQKADNEITNKYNHIHNTNKVFFDDYNTRLFFAINAENQYYSINLNYNNSSLSAHWSGNIDEISHGFVGTTLLSMEKSAYLWDSVLVAQQEEIIFDILKLVNSNFKSLTFVANPYSQDKTRVPYMSAIGHERRIPLKSQGYGTQRLLQIALAIYQAKDGFLLIDEFENGLHYSVQEQVWGLIFDMAQRLNIQVFATTHSWDCIEAFSKVAVERTDVEGLLFRMGRSARTSDKGKVIATVFDEDKLQHFTQADMEIR